MTIVHLIAVTTFKKYSEKDRRLKVYRNDANIGLSNNFNLLTKKSEGKYFLGLERMIFIINFMSKNFYQK